MSRKQQQRAQPAPDTDDDEENYTTTEESNLPFTIRKGYAPGEQYEPDPYTMKAFKEWESSTCGTFFNAVYGKKMSIAQTILERDPSAVKCKLPDGMTPLHFLIFAAVRNSDYSSAQYKMTNFLLDNKADVNAADPPLGMAPLHLAAFDDSNEDFVDILLKKGAQLEQKTEEGGLTPIHVATINGSSNIIKKLIKAGAMVDSLDAEGFTPLHRASMMNLQKVAETLVSSKANVNAKIPSSHRTPAHLAAKFCSTEVATMLAKSKADLDIQDKKGMTPKALAELNNCVSVAGVYSGYMKGGKGGK